MNFCLPIGSSDAGDDAVVGNVNKLAVFPHGYCGKLKKGHLIFDACFESGKYLCLLSQNNTHVYQALIRKICVIKLW